ncbi:MAG TPA: hypothetical protein VK563_07820 [Puia sp.]|nr:hypothetical protein [Puia sp.]
MYNPKAPPFATEGTRSLLKNQHKKIYSICRLFSTNYKEHQHLFAGIIAATARSIEADRTNEEKSTLLLRACINMAALHSLSGSLGLPGEGPGDGGREIQFKSPDYQKSMVRFREEVGEITDYEKILLFLNFEHVAPSEIPRLSGLPESGPAGMQATERRIPEMRVVARKIAGTSGASGGVNETPAKKSFIPYLKELIWS